jgi:hypothetical protein
MPYKFRRVAIRIFDFHLSLDPLVAPASLNPAVDFLGDPAKYKLQFEAKPVVAGAFRVRPLRKKSRTYHHFWKYYADAFGEFDPWRMLVPFLCEPTQYKLAVTDPRKGVRAFARPATYLFPFGWATTIEMSLHGKDMTASELRDFIGALRNQTDGPFLLDGKPIALSAVLKKYGEEIKKTCFKKGTAAADFRRVDRHMIVSLSQFDGNITYYKPRYKADTPMPAADKAALHGILLGREVSPAEIITSDENGKPGFLLTRFADAGFALTYFDRGILLFVQNKAIRPECGEAMDCFSTNLMSCMMMLLSLQSFRDFPQTKNAAAKSLLADVRDLAQQRIVELPLRYKNAVLTTWCKFNDPAPKADDKAKDGK